MKKALLVIDVQKLYTDIENDYLVDDGLEVVDRINSIINAFSEKNEEIIYIRHIHAADGSDSGRMFDFTGEEGEVEFVENTVEVEYSDKLTIAPNAMHLIKHRYDSFCGTDLDSILRSSGVDGVVIVGFMTNFCCEATARRAHDLDYYVDFVKDATGTPGVEGLTVEQVIEATCATLAAGYANILSAKEVIS